MAWVPVERSPGSYLTVRKPPDRCPEGHPWAPGNGYLYEYIACNCATSRIVGWSGHDRFCCVTCNGTIIDPPCQVRG